MAATGSIECSALLPESDGSLTAIARPVAAHARPLLAASRAHLLSLTMIRGNAVPVTMCWNGSATAVTLHSAIDVEEPQLGRTLAAFAVVGQRLITHLTRRWPSYAVPPAIGIVTDGGGVVFSADHPSPLSPNWLALHQSGLCATTTILAFSGFGAWALLTSPMADRGSSTVN